VVEIAVYLEQLSSLVRRLDFTYTTLLLLLLLHCYYYQHQHRHNTTHHLLTQHLPSQLDPSPQQRPRLRLAEHLNAQLIKHGARALVVSKQPLLYLPETKRRTRLRIRLRIRLRTRVSVSVRARRFFLRLVSVPGTPSLAEVVVAVLGGSRRGVGTGRFATCDREADKLDGFETATKTHLGDAGARCLVDNTADGAEVGVQLCGACCREAVPREDVVP
jgi:hypothetical protein